ERCSQRFERFVFLREADTPAVCPNCGTTETRKLLSTFAAIDRKGSTGSSSSCGPSGG
ncbi:MAG: zinc ribbon domain-containing protein, partial [Ktedonobacteraceae bacterium]|nr:zinc ribbon domain-containing protein [Ktedonobacteraceae bacterium]